jgi:hypothetical protein
VVFQIISFLAGGFLVLMALFSAVRTLVIPRAIQDWLSRFVFTALRRVFTLRLRRMPDYASRDRLLAYYAPVGSLLLVPAWYLLILLGYTCMYWAIDPASWYQAFRLSGSSLFTLGFAAHDGLGFLLLSFSEAGFGLLLVALMIAYLPTMYAGFSRREVAVTKLDVRAGSPPSPVEMLKRFHRIQGLGRLQLEWEGWETWFAEIEESHTSLAALVFFRSPRREHSWINAAETVLDSAALRQSVVDLPPEPQASLCIRAGYLALRHISDFFGIPYNPDPKAGDPISITRERFDAAFDELKAAGLPIKSDREQAWRDFSGWRVNYDAVLIPLARLTAAPPAAWLLSQKDVQDLFNSPVR